MAKDISGMLPFFLRHGNISYIENGRLYIIDRRLLPFERRTVECRDALEASAAIRSMVTQGGGPLEVALNALKLEAMHGGDIEAAVRALSGARPTNTTMKRTLEAILSSGEDIESAVDMAFRYYDDAYDAVSDRAEALIEDGDGILTTCFPEHTFMLSVAKAMANGKRIRVYVPETRPYLQGAHLTEPCLREIGAECYLITDGMPAHFMQRGMIQKYMTASDLALSDRTVVNKTGTLSNAIAASYFGIPYYALSMGIDSKRTKSDIEIEYRSGDEIRKIGNLSVAEDDARCIYPCFDMIPSELVRGIVTKEGIL